MKMPVAGLPPGSLPDPADRERAGRRRLAAMALAVLCRPASAAELSAALGCELGEALDDACERGQVRRGAGELFEPALAFDVGAYLLGFEEARQALLKLLPLAGDSFQAFLMAASSDPAGEALRRARSLPPDSPLQPLAAALAAAPGREPMEELAPLDLAALGDRARTVYGAVAGACLVFVRDGPLEAGFRLGQWALGEDGPAGRIQPAQGGLAAVTMQALMDLGQGAEAVAFSREARPRLGAPEDRYFNLTLLAIEGHLAADRGELAEARRIFSQVQHAAAEHRFEDLQGICRIAFGTLAFRAGQTAGAAQLYRSALEIIAGNTRYEALALHYLGLTYLKLGQPLAAQAALTASLPYIDSLLLQLSGYATAIACDAFLGDEAAAQQKLQALAGITGGRRFARMVLALCQAHAKSIGGQWAEALALLESDAVAQAVAHRPAYAVSVRSLQVTCLRELGRLEEAAARHQELAQLHHFNNLSSHQCALHLQDAELALAQGDRERARRALHRAEEEPELLRAYDFELRARALALALAEAERRAPKIAQARERATDAWSRLTAGFSTEQVARFRRSQDRPRLLARLALKQDETPPGLPYMRGASAQFTALVEQLRRVAPSRTSVLLLGETGVGKELCARAIHDLSDRREGPFIPLNCAAVTDELFLSELFGHEKGAFTGAVQRHIGRFEQADGGTLFLDEIADMSPRAQAAVLRALQERTFERVGGTTVLRADVRLVAASNRDLAEAVTAGEFRKDLYYRLCGVQVFVPPLRSRGDDALLLAARFLEESAADRQGPARAFSPEAERLIRTHSWPGNIRELRNAVQAVDLLCEAEVIPADLLESLLQRDGAARALRGSSAPEDRFASFRAEGLTLKEYLGRLQAEFIARTLELNGGNVAAAAADLGFSRSRLSQIVYGTEELRRRASGERRPARRRKRREAH